MRVLSVAAYSAATMLALIAPQGGAAAAEVSPRERTLAVLEMLVGQPQGHALEAWVNDGSGAPISIGDEIEYHFVSERAAYLMLIHVDSHGVMTLLSPGGGAEKGRVDAGVERSFPPSEAGFELRAEPPVGAEAVIVLATPAPISNAELGLPDRSEAVSVIEAEAAPALAERLRARFAAFDATARAAVRFDQQILGRSAEAEYASVDIVDYFTTRTRSIQRPRLDLHVHFDTGSAELDSAARENLDEMAVALADPRLRGLQFRVGGHTDDVGDEAYNDDLSRRRAESVVRYLVVEGSIDSERLAVSHYGETRPLDPRTTPDARRLNRRVEFELQR